MNNQTITGYQWGEAMRFIGPYTFPHNGDAENIHMPPNTTLIAPPPTGPGQFAEWDAEGGTWLLRDEPPAPAAPVITDEQRQAAWIEAEAAARARAAMEAGHGD